MITKKYSKDKASCKVTFELDADESERLSAKTVHVAGEFNEWNWPDSKMSKRKTGGFYKTIDLPAGRAYQFRYVINETNWINDTAADGFATNDVGSENSVVEV